MRTWKSLFIPAILIAILMSGCGASRTSGDSGAVPESGIPANITQTADTSHTPSASPSSSAEPSASASASPMPDPDRQLKQAARDVVDVLRDRDLEQLALAADPEQGLRFSPYPHIDVKTAPLFKAGELPTFKDAKARNWGSYDGSGEPIDLTFRDYFEKFVYDSDFSSAPDISVNKLIGQGNTPFNGLEVYPDASYVEFHFPGGKDNDGMDWKSLILVFRHVGEEWKLCAVVHGQWTI